MTDLADDVVVRDDTTLVREFEAQLERATTGDGRTVEMRVVPFGETAICRDGHGGVPYGDPYEEQWMPGCFDNQLRAADKIQLNYRHEQGLRGVIGTGRALRAEPDGYHGTFRVVKGPDGDKALELISEGALNGASIEVPFHTVKSVRASSGIIQRIKGHLAAVALCPIGAFPSAVVTALREGEVAVDDEMLPPALDSEVVQRLQKLGLEVPEAATGVLERAFTSAAWDGSSSRWPTAEAYCSSALIDLNPSGQPKTKDKCHLPIKEPGGGTINVNAVRNALSRIGAGQPTDASQAQRDAAKSTLLRYLAQSKASSSAQRQADDVSNLARYDTMIAMTKNLLANEPEQPDRTTLQGILNSLQSLRRKEAAESPAG